MALYLAVDCSEDGLKPKSMKTHIGLVKEALKLSRKEIVQTKAGFNSFTDKV